MLSIIDVDPTSEINIRLRDGAVHVIRWNRGTPPFTLCRQYVLEHDPSDETMRRSKGLVPSCVGCIGAYVPLEED